MKTKLLLRFYFNAERVDRAIDNLIMSLACGAEGGTERTAERIIELYGRKDELAALWEYLDGVISHFGEGADILRGYGLDRYKGSKRLLQRVIMRFRRRAGGACRFTAAQELLKYYAVFMKTSCVCP